MEKTKEILNWLVSAGVTETTGENPVNRFNSVEEQAILKKPLVEPAPVSVEPVTPPDNLLQNAIDAARKAKTLAELQKAVESFDGCALKKTAKSTVFGVGPTNAKIMFIGEAPGADEDRIGQPFVGVSGQLLDKMMKAVGLSRLDNAYITNIIPWRPPGNRSPSSAEISICMPFIERHIELIRPDVIVMLGGVAMTALLGNPTGITKARGTWAPYQTPHLDSPIQTMPIYHPAFLLRNPIQKKFAWHDMLAIREKLDALGDV